MNPETSHKITADMFEHHQRGRKATINEMVYDLEGVQEIITVLTRALHRPPRGATKDEMERAQLLLIESRAAEANAVAVLAKLGVKKECVEDV